MTLSETSLLLGFAAALSAMEALPDGNALVTGGIFGSHDKRAVYVCRGQLYRCGKPTMNAESAFHRGYECQCRAIPPVTNALRQMFG
jgi:hypothetical protein